MKLLPFLLGILPGLCPAASISLSFHNGASTVTGLTGLAAGTVVNTTTTTWNNVQNNAGVGLNFSGFVLKDATGADSGARLASSAGFSTFNNNGWSTHNQDWNMMEGWYGFKSTEGLTITNLPSAFTVGGYTVTIYGDSDQPSRTMNYTVSDGVISPTLTILDSGTFAGTFTSGVNKVTFTGLSGSTLTIKGNALATDTRSAINGIVITAVPEPSSAAVGLLGFMLLIRRRR